WSGPADRPRAPRPRTTASPEEKDAASFLCHHVDLAVERVAPRVVALRFEDVEEEIAIAPERAVGVADADRVLPALAALFRARIDEGDLAPAVLRQISRHVGHRI